MFEIIKYIKHKLNRPLLFWPVKFGMDWLVILTHDFTEMD